MTQEVGSGVVNLDTHEVFERLDTRAMRDYIRDLPAQCRQAWDAGQAWPLPDSLRTPKRIVILGMGGSAIGAEVVATVASRLSTIPVQVVRNYTPPPVDSDTLVIASSYSGETEETLEAFQRTMGADAMRLAITSSGRLKRLGAELGYHTFEYEFPSQPRAAIGWGVYALLAILQRIGAVPIHTHDVEASIAALEVCAADWGIDVPSEQNAAKQIARSLQGRIPVIFGPDLLEVAARRWAGQMNENAKHWAMYAVLPELDHNLIVGFTNPGVHREALHVLTLDSAAIHQRNRLRVQLTATALDNEGVPHDELLLGGGEPLDAIMRACYLSDWVSLYLAMLNEVDPTPVKVISWLKDELAKQR